MLLRTYNHKSTVSYTTTSIAPGLNALAGKLPAIVASERRGNSILVLRTLYLDITRREEDLDVHGVALVWVDTTVGTESTTASFLQYKCQLCCDGVGVRTYRCLLNDDALDCQVLQLKTLRVRIGLSVLQEIEEEANRLLGPATCHND